MMTSDDDNKDKVLITWIRLLRTCNSSPFCFYVPKRDGDESDDENDNDDDDNDHDHDHK